jgi:ABC-type Fe3+-siderophore transport system, permease component
LTYDDKRKKNAILFCLMVFAALIEVVVCTAVGAADIPFNGAVKAVLSKIPLLKDMINLSGIKESHVIIITGLRLPRVILSAVIGAGLSSVGTSFQGIFKNPLADPYIIGASAGGALGAAAAIVVGSRVGLNSFGVVSIFAFCGSLSASCIVYMLGKVGARLSTSAIILSGVALNSMLSAILSLILLFNRQQATQIVYWTMGSFSAGGWNQVLIAVPGVVIGIVILYFFSRDLNLMTLGEETAQHLGVDTSLLKKIILLTGSLITGLSVAVSGIIGFVGIVIPHIMRLIFGPDNRTLIPFASIGGAMFLMGVDALSRVLIPPSEIPVGILTAAVGGPFFIYLLLKSKKKLA